MGRTTFEPALSNDRWPWPNLDVFVLGSQRSSGTPDHVVSDSDPARLLETLRAANQGGDVHLVGGPRTIETFRTLGALDKLELVVLPLLFGAGMRLTPSLSPDSGLRFERECPSGRLGRDRLLSEQAFERFAGARCGLVPGIAARHTCASTRSSGRGTWLRSSASTSNRAYRIFRLPPLPMKRRSCSSVVRPCHGACFCKVRNDPSSPDRRRPLPRRRRRERGSARPPGLRRTRRSPAVPSRRG